MSGCLTELLLFSHSLFCYSFRPFTYLFRITEKIVFDKSQPVVEFKNVRNCCRQVQVEMSVSDISLRCLMIPRRLLPWATTSRLSLHVNVGKMMHFQ